MVRNAWGASGQHWQTDGFGASADKSLGRGRAEKKGLGEGQNKQVGKKGRGGGEKGSPERRKRGGELRRRVNPEFREGNWGAALPDQGPEERRVARKTRTGGNQGERLRKARRRCRKKVKKSGGCRGGPLLKALVKKGGEVVRIQA